MIVALAPSVGAFHGNPLVMSVTTTSRTSTSFPRRVGSMTRLHYVSGAEHDHTATATAAPQHTWWSGIFGGGDQSSAADEYLEFLDKRYNSILKDEEAESKGFSVMDWLYPNGRDTAETVTKQQEEDALYVLGVANLASKKFLQRRHRLPAPAAQDAATANQSVARRNAMVVTDAEIVETKKINSAPVAAAVAVFQEVARRREALIQKQTKGVRAAMACIARSLLTGPVRAFKAMEKLFVMGGGKQSLAVTCAAMAAFSFLLRPLLRVAAVEGANSMRP